MTNDENSEQPISNQVERDDEYQEIYDFLECQLKMRPLNAKERGRLDWGISAAIRAMGSVHVREVDRYHRFCTINDDTQKLVKHLRNLMKDSESLALMQTSKERCNLATVLNTENALCRLSNCIDEVVANNWSAPPETPIGSPEKGEAFTMFIYHLLQTWKDIYGKRPSTSSATLKNPPIFRGHAMDVGQRGGKFVYFAHAVRIMSDISIAASEFGVAIRDVLREKTFKKTLDELDTPNDGSVEVIMDDEPEVNNG